MPSKNPQTRRTGRSKPLDSACESKTFVEFATTELGFRERTAENVWRGMVQKVRGAKYDRPLALREKLTFAQMQNFLQEGRVTGKGQWGYLQSDSWRVVELVVPALLRNL